jgi:hypothetical protein
MRDTLGTIAVGSVFGFTLSRIGFTSWDEVHRMFTFDSLRMLLAFCLAVVALTASWYVVARTSSKPPRWTLRQIHKGTIAGGLIFGAGWALSGACPSIALVQLGEGKLLALYTVVGIFAGNWLYSVVHERFFRWTTASCVDA